MKIVRNTLYIITLFTTPIHLAGSLRAPDSQTLFGGPSQKLGVFETFCCSDPLPEKILEDFHEEKSMFLENNISQKTLIIIAFMVEIIDKFPNDDECIRKWFALYIEQLSQEECCELEDMVHMLDIKPLVNYYAYLNKRFKCSWPGCGFATNYKANLERHAFRMHVKSNHNQKERENLGEKSEHTSAGLSKNELLSHCPYCTYGSVDKNELWVHYREQHKSERPFQCSLCNYSAKRKCNLQYHQAVHRDRGEDLSKNEELYPCLYCTYGSNDKSGLWVHYREQHKNKRPFQCSLCDYSAERELNLKNHLMRHSGEKPFKCTFANCDYSARQKNLLNSHINKCH